MKITIESTTKIVTMDGITCRVWEGRTAGGVPIHAFIPRIGVARDEDSSELQTELEEMNAPASAEIEAIPARLIL